MPVAGEPTLGETVLGNLLDNSHFLRADEIPQVARDAARQLGADDAIVYVIDRDQRLLVALDDPTSTLDVDGTIPGRAYRTREVLQSQAGLWVPLLDGADRVGVLHAATESPVDEVLRFRMRWLASIIALLTVTKQHFGDTIERAKRTRPMAIAAELRWALLPPLTYRNHHVEIAAMLEPAYEVAGDALDYAVDGPITNVALFDAMGHGIEAARMANLAIATYRNARRAGSDLEATARLIDRLLYEEFGPERFVTAVLLRLDARSGEVEVVLCGHPRPLHLRGAHVIGQVQAALTVPLGLGAQPEGTRMSLEVGDRILLFTDGVTEAKSPDGSDFGVDRLADFVSKASQAGEIPSETVRRLAHDVMEHAEELRDDATLVLLGWPAAMNGDS